jgi:hypothetical protein
VSAVTPVLAVLAAAAWLWFLAVGRFRGAAKRIALRATLLLLLGGMWAVAASRGLLLQASSGFRVALLLALLVVAVGYLYLIRFCDVCGRMVRNLKPAVCPRCGAPLPRHGMTSKLRRVDPAAGEEQRGRRRG